MEIMLQLGILATILSPYLIVVPTLLVLVAISQKKAIPLLNPVSKGLFLLAACALLSGVVNASPLSAGSAAVIVCYALIAAYLYWAARDADLLLLLRKVWRFAVAAAALGILEKVASYFFNLAWIASFYLDETIDDIYRIYSTFGNPNIAGAWFAAMILVGLYLFQAEYFQRKLYYAVGLVLLAAALLFSGSRGATFSVEVGLVVYALLDGNKFNRTILWFTFAGILLLALLSPEINHTWHDRIQIWVKRLALFAQSPVLGTGTFGSRQQLNILHAHNIWISILTLYGLVGFCIYLWSRVSLYKSFLLLKKQKAPLLPLLASLQAILLAHGIVDCILLSPQGGVLYFAVAATVCGLAARGRVGMADGAVKCGRAALQPEKVTKFLTRRKLVRFSRNREKYGRKEQHYDHRSSTGNLQNRNPSAAQPVKSG